MSQRSISRPTCRIPEHRRRRSSTAGRSKSTAPRSKEIAVGRGGECNEHTRPAVPPPTSVRPRSGRIVNPRDNVRRRRCRARRRVACHSRNNATAPRSPRSGWRYRGSHEGSLHSPPCDPRLFPSTAPRSSSPKNRGVAQRHVRGATSTKQWTRPCGKSPIVGIDDLSIRTASSSERAGGRSNGSKPFRPSATTSLRLHELSAVLLRYRSRF